MWLRWNVNALCVDKIAPEVGFTCVCSSGYVESGGVCVNENGCESDPCYRGMHCGMSRQCCPVRVIHVRVQTRSCSSQAQTRQRV